MKRFIAKFDIFAALPVLRAQGDSEVVNLCGGIFSLAIISAFTYIFFSILASTVQLQLIQATQKIETRQSHQQRVGNITIAIGLQQKNLLELSNIFTVRAQITDENFNYRSIDTFPCRKDIWEKLPSLKYNSLKIDTHVCVQKEGVEIYGGSDSPTYNMLQLSLSQCLNYTGSSIVCASQSEIDDFFRNQKMIGRFIPASLLILQASFSTSHKNPLTYSVFEKTLWLLFSEKQQIIGQIFIGTYQINTDISFMPVQAIQTLRGCFVNEGIISTTVNQNTTDFIIIFFEISPIHMTIDRQYGKVDEILSYVGGLFGIIVSFFAFFMMSFNQYKYELRVSQGAFTFKDGHLARQRDLHFGKYVKYAIYDWIKMLFCHQLSWKDCKAIQEAREEAIQQIDVKYLLKRISHLQKVISLLVKPQKHTIASLMEMKSIQQVKKRRSIQEYVENFSDLYHSITIQNFEQSANYILDTSEVNTSYKVAPLQHMNSQHKQKNQQNSELIHDDDLTSFSIMKKYLTKYQSKFQISEKSIDLSEENLRTEAELAHAYFELDERTRRKIVKRIPLGILYRFDSQRKGNIKKGSELRNETQNDLKGNFTNQEMVEAD